MSTEQKLQRHPKAATFPPLSDQAYRALKASINHHGLQQPIEVQAGSNLLLDGRHRHRACQELGRPVMQQRYDNPTPDQIADALGKVDDALRRQTVRIA